MTTYDLAPVDDVAGPRGDVLLRATDVTEQPVPDLLRGVGGHQGEAAGTWGGGGSRVNSTVPVSLRPGG
ncbi:hypothetical protein [Streptomyces sp. NBC_01235]|uniref:hypothetical protein n=1 Tax=Streptomyces sp. NBC_01235 TaxID=2903788 RepID=UPI002E152BE6|nr:hypothetical protein OG289_01640 [Streptomyces sp. NBC_01235]